MVRTTITEEQARKILSPIGTNIFVFNNITSLDGLNRLYLHDDIPGAVTVWDEDIPVLEPDEFSSITAWVLEETLSNKPNVHLTAWEGDVCVFRYPVVLAAVTSAQILAALEK